MSSLTPAVAEGEHRRSTTPVDAGARPARSIARTLGGIFVAVVTVIGIAGFALALMPFFGWQTVVLATGSMAPQYPAGAIVVERMVPASELATGDIVTLMREGKPPVTHRIIAIAPAAGILPSRELTLQGDANDDPDPRPYVVESAGLVVFGSPWGGQVIGFLRTPLALVLITVLVAGLVLKAWWPQRPATASPDDTPISRDEARG